MTQIQPPPAGSPYQGGQPPAGIPYQGGPPPAGLGGPQPGHPYPPQLPRKTNTLAIVSLVLAFVVAPVGLILGIVALSQIRKRGEAGKGLAVAGVVLGVLFTLAGVAAVLLVTMITPTLDTNAVETRISATTQQAVGTAPTAVTCPDSVDVAQGGTFTCTAAVNGQNLPFTVTQNDDKGNVTFEQTGWLLTANPQKDLVDAATKNFPANQWSATCADGKTAFVGGPGTTFTCTLFVTDNPVQREDHTVRVTSNTGDYEITN